MNEKLSSEKTTSASKPWFKDRDSRFFCLPPSAITDRRLTFEDLRVLMALAFHANKATGACKVCRKTITKLTGVHPSNVSESTTRLEKLGWLEKVFRGHRAVQYRLLPASGVAGGATHINSVCMATPDVKAGITLDLGAGNGSK